MRRIAGRRMLAAHRAGRRRGDSRGATTMILATTHVRVTTTASWRSSRPRAPRSAGPTAARARRSSATPRRRTASGRSSTGTRRGGRASSPTPRSRRSCSEAGHTSKAQTAEFAGRLWHPTRWRTPWKRHRHPSARSRWASSPTRRARCRSWASRTRTWPTMVVDDINAAGGLLGRPLELIVEDSATDRRRSRAAKAAKLVQRGPRGRASSAASTAPRGRRSRARPWRRAARSTSTPSSTRGRSATR